MDRVEAYHGSYPDGYTTLPALEEGAVLAPRLDHCRVLGTASFFGHEGLDVTAPTIHIGISSSGTRKRFDADSPEGVGEVTELDIVQHVNETESRFSKAYFVCRPTTRKRRYSLVAATQISDGIRGDSLNNTEQGLAWWSLLDSGIHFGDQVDVSFGTFPRPLPPVVFCCLVCEDAGTVKRKVGIAFVKAIKHTWSLERHRIA
jgi:hypothetical protein